MRKGKGKNSKLLPNSLRIISSCIKTVSTNASTAVRSAGASVAASISPSDDRKEQVLWAGFDKLELSPTAFRRVLLIGYLKGFQIFDVEDASGLSELLSRRDGPVTFLQMLPAPTNGDGTGKYIASHPIVVVVGGNEDERITSFHYSGQGSPTPRCGSPDSSFGSSFDPPTAVRFYSMKSNEYVKVIDFKSPVFMVRCSSRVVAIGLEEQVYCFDSLTLEKKFIVVTYPVPRVGDQGAFGINTGYGPLAVGPRWLAYPPSHPFLLNSGRVSPKSLASSVSPSTSPGSGTMMARYAMESSKHLASGLISLGDMGYKKLSKYYPELLPGSPSSPGWKAGKLAASEPENAGVIAVKDLACSEVISQFRAHTSPISALCFDPSGTLLVTASVHGNNINIFRIMPCHKCNGSGSVDWSTSYVHLYKLYRGITSAVIQDICFSQYSQWVAIVSSKGTCHIYVLSPFGGDDGFFRTVHTQGKGTSLFLASTPPWWSTSSFTINEPHSLPPPPCNLSVVTRIKSSDSGLLNSVSNAAASMVGKSWVPSGAFAAVFHNSNSTISPDAKSGGNSLEHILVYTPSGFVVQHEILSSMGVELGESRTESLSAPQSEEFRVKVEPLQWWDVGRRLDNMEREECIFDGIFDGQNDPEIDEDSEMVLQESLSAGKKKLVKTNSLKSPERLQWYLSNAEVQINSCRVPIWQKSKIHFHVLKPQRQECFSDGESEIEMAPSHEIDVREKKLLPIFDNFHRARSGWIDRSLPSDSNNGQLKEKTSEASIISPSDPSSFSSTESSEGGLPRRMENLLDLDQTSTVKSPITVRHAAASDINTEREDNTNLKVSLTGIPPLNVDNADSAANILMSSKSEEKTVDFAQLFKEEYYNKPEFHDRDRSTEDVDDDIDTAGLFDFSEEG